MKTGKLRKVTGFWKSLFFMGNVCKIRKCLMGYLEEEGLKCEFVDGEIIFEYNDCHFTTSFVVNDGFSYCHISYRCDDDDYEKLNMADKAFVADKVNTDMGNQAIVYAFKDNIQVNTSFYFTSKNMMIDLFSKHFEELTENLNEAIHIVCSKVEEQKKVRCRRIGFNTEPYKHEEAEHDLKIVAAQA